MSEYFSFFSQFSLLFPKHYTGLQLSWPFDMKELDNYHKLELYIFCWMWRRILTLFPNSLRAGTAVPVSGFFTQTSGEQRHRDTSTHISKYFQIYPALLVYCSLQLFAPRCLYSGSFSQAKKKSLLKLVLSHFYTFSHFSFLFSLTAVCNYSYHFFFVCSNVVSWEFQLERIGKVGLRGCKGVLLSDNTKVKTARWYCFK